MQMVYCRGCANQIHETAPTCPKCGAVQFAKRQASTSAPGGKEKTAAAMLAFFLGLFGVHRFYLGGKHTVWGAIYLCTCGLAFVGGIIDGIRYISMPDNAWEDYVTSGRW